MRLVIGGDLCPIGRNEGAFRTAGAAAKAVSAVMGARDLFVANLECPLVAHPSPILKGGPALRALPETAAGLAAMGVDVAVVANNHILDHGPAGLESTLAALDAAGIRHVGAGASLDVAGRPLLVPRASGRPVAILAFAENEYSIATRGAAGASPFELTAAVRALRALSGRALPVVLIHGGNEFHPYPSPRLRESCRLLVELGARAVVVQHTHCVGCYERYADGLIVYGQGNLIFDYPVRRAAWWEGLLVSITLGDEAIVGFELIPVIQDPGARILVRAEGADRDRILSGVEQRSSLVADDEALEREWRRFCDGVRRNYQSLLFGHSRPVQIANRLLGFADWRTRAAVMNVGNVLRCDSHLDVLRTLYSAEATAGVRSRAR